MKKILNSIKHKGSREELTETRRGRGSVEARRSADLRHDNQVASKTSHNTPAAAAPSSSHAPSHAPLNMNGSGAFVNAREYPDNKRLSRDSNSAAATSATRTSDPFDNRKAASTVVNTTTTTTVNTSSPTINSNANRYIDQPKNTGATNNIGTNTGNTSKLGVASNTGLASKAATLPTSPTRANENTSSTLPMSSAATAISRDAVSNKEKVLDPDVRLPAGFDINDSEDTDKQVRYAKAVVHETVQPVRHHIVHEQIVREIHNHDVYHRILPIIDVEVLPAKHYIQDPKNPLKLLEVAEHEVPGYRGPGKHNWQIVETVSKLDTAPHGEKVGNRFTARSFAPNEGATREWVDEEGIQRSERTWVHPPVSAPREGTVPLYMGTWPEHDVESQGSINPGWPGMPGHSLPGHNSAVMENNTSLLKSGEHHQQAGYRPTAGARSASSRSDYVRSVDHGLDHEKRGTNGIETVNAGMSGLAV